MTISPSPLVEQLADCLAKAHTLWTQKDPLGQWDDELDYWNKIAEEAIVLLACQGWSPSTQVGPDLGELYEIVATSYAKNGGIGAIPKDILANFHVSHRASKEQN